jgi:hypothetical protein
LVTECCGIGVYLTSGCRCECGEERYIEATPFLLSEELPGEVEANGAQSALAYTGMKLIFSRENIPDLSFEAST